VMRVVLFAVLAAPAWACAWIGSGSAGQSGYACAVGVDGASCCSHSDCAATQYCFDYGFFSTGTWSNIGQCSNVPAHCCYGQDQDPIDRNPANCPAASNCGSASPPATPSSTSGDDSCVGGANDGDCDDGGPGAEYTLCYPGTDDTDCNRTGSLAGRRLDVIAPEFAPSPNDKSVIGEPTFSFVNTVERVASDEEVSRMLITQPGRKLSGTRACTLNNIYTGSCGALAQKSECWETYSYLTTSGQTTQEICCANGSGDCCEGNPGAIAGVVIGGIVILVLSIVACVACCVSPCCACCPCNKHNAAKNPPGGGGVVQGQQVAVEMNRA